MTPVEDSHGGTKAALQLLTESAEAPQCRGRWHIAPCGRAYRGQYRCPCRQPTLGRKCLNRNQKKCKFLLCGRCCQAPFPILPFPLFFSLRVVSLGPTEPAHMRSRAQESRYGNACEHLSEQRRPVPSFLAQRPMLPVTWPRYVWRLPVAWRSLVSNDLLSVRTPAPVTRCSLRLSTRAGRLRGGDPIYTTACCAGPEFARAASTSAQTEA
jgi:hypothetical protein